MGAIATSLLSPVAFCWWEQAATQPRSSPRSFWAWAEDMGDLTDRDASF